MLRHNLTRDVMNYVTGGIAMAFPNFAGLACLFGSVTSIMFTFLFPFFCDLCYQITGGRNEEDDEDDEGKPLRYQHTHIGL